MNALIKIRLGIIAILVISLVGCGEKSTTAKKVIYETNMCAAVDDVGGLAMIHALQNRGEAELLAVCLNEVHPSGVAAVDAINTWYGRGDIPVGVFKGHFEDPDESAYLDNLAKFPHDIDNESAPSAVEVYRKVLAEQPDASVTIISVGFMNNLDRLLDTDRELVARKAKELVIMAFHIDDGGNLVAHNTVAAAENVIENWPTPIVFHSMGEDIFTGSGLADSPEGNPVREAYYSFSNSNFEDQTSWDQITVLYGVRGTSDNFVKNSTGIGRLPNGFEWELKTRSDSFLEALQSPEVYARIIEELMLEAPAR
ncbi:hypothetical protein ACFL45_05935 [Candidatus Neomarinimicrobiota bacterium]